MSDKHQFVAGFRHSSTAESPDKLKFVGHLLRSAASCQSAESGLIFRNMNWAASFITTSTNGFLLVRIWLCRTQSSALSRSQLWLLRHYFCFTRRSRRGSDGGLSDLAAPRAGDVEGATQTA